MSTKAILAGGSGTVPLAARPLAVLVVEDNPVNQTLVAHMLECMGHATTLAEHGAQALELAADNDFDAILMDMQMPVMDGATATRLIRMLPGERATVPVIALTADSCTDHSELLETNQLTAFLTKPVSLEVLSNTLDQVVAGRAPAAGDQAEPDAGPPVLDSAYLDDMRQWVGNETVMNLLASAPASLRAELVTLAAAWRISDWSQVRETAHRLKGAAGSVGARRLSNLAHAVQKMSAADFSDSAHLEALAAELDSAIAAFSAWRPPA